MGHIRMRDLKAANRWLSILIPKKLPVVIRSISCLGLLIGILMSYKLWVNSRFYPVAPVSDLIPLLSAPYDYALLIIVVVLLTILIFYQHKALYFGLFIGFSYLILQDQSRLQPWFYYYLFILGAVALYDLKSAKNEPYNYVNICRIILAGVYFWSGLQKLNHAYLFDLFPWLVSPLTNFIPLLNHIPLSILAISSAVFEVIAAICLLIPRTRKYAVWLLISMHIFILLMIGPLGLNFNEIVWPWNISFILLLGFLFLKKPFFSWRSLLIPKSIFHGIAVFLFVIVPVLNFGGYWDHSLSSSLYSGKKPYAKIYVPNALKAKFPDEVILKFSAQNELFIRDWSYVELNVADYTESRIYTHIFHRLCDYQKRENSLVLEVYDTANIVTGHRSKKIYFCHEV